jgi:flagellar biosynthesis protein FliQ
MTDAVLHALREALVLVALVAAPPVVAALAAGVIAGVLQTATQVRDASLSVVPRVAAALVALAIAGPWIGAQVSRFWSAILDAVPALARAG